MTKVVDVVRNGELRSDVLGLAGSRVKKPKKKGFGPGFGMLGRIVSSTMMTREDASIHKSRAHN